MIKPTVGRMVWFWPEEPRTDRVQPEAAIVTYVYSDNQVNLAAFSEAGVARPRLGVALLQDDQQPPKGKPYATWMPYQKGQAAKLEEAEKSQQERERQQASVKAQLEQKLAESRGASTPPASNGPAPETAQA